MVLLGKYWPFSKHLKLIPESKQIYLARSWTRFAWSLRSTPHVIEMADQKRKRNVVSSLIFKFSDEELSKPKVALFRRSDRVRTYPYAFPLPHPPTTPPSPEFVYLLTERQPPPRPHLRYYRPDGQRSPHSRLARAPRRDHPLARKPNALAHRQTVHLQRPRSQPRMDRPPFRLQTQTRKPGRPRRGSH